MRHVLGDVARRDTLVCLIEGIAEAYCGPVAEPIRLLVKMHLADELWTVTDEFCERHVLY